MLRRPLTLAAATTCLVAAATAPAQAARCADGATAARSALVVAPGGSGASAAAFASDPATTTLVRLGRRGGATTTPRPALLAPSVVVHPDGRSEVVGWAASSLDPTAAVVAIDAHGARHTLSGDLPLPAGGAAALRLAAAADGDRGLVLAFAFGSKFAIARIARTADGGFLGATTTLVPDLAGRPASLRVDATGVAFAAVAGPDGTTTTVIRQAPDNTYTLATDAAGAPAPALDGRGGAWLTGGDGEARHFSASGVAPVATAGTALGLADAEGRLLALDGDRLLRIAPDGTRTSGRYASPLRGHAQLAAAALDRSTDRPVVVSRYGPGGLELSRGQRLVSLPLGHAHSPGQVDVAVARDGTAWALWDTFGDGGSERDVCLRDARAAASVRWARLAPGAVAPSARGTLRGVAPGFALTGT